MTIIAYCARTDNIYVDQQYNFQCGLKPEHRTKIRDVGDYLVASCGTYPQVSINEMLVPDCILKGHLKIDFETHGDSIARRKSDGKVFLISVVNTVMIVLDNNVYGDDWCTGSGSDWFYAYRRAGLGSVAECAALVIKHHSECGGNLEVF